MWFYVFCNLLTTLEHAVQLFEELTVEVDKTHCGSDP